MRPTMILALLLVIGCDGGTVEEVVAPGCPTLSLSATAVDFVEGRLDAPSTQELTLTHGCAAGPELAVQALLSGGSAFGVEPAAVSLAPGDSALLTITFAPQDYDDAQSELFVLSNDPVEDTKIVALTGSVDPDQDGDGFEARAVGGEDCDDASAERNPDGTEIWNGADDDCDGQIDVLPVTSVAHGWVSGGTYRSLAFQGNLGMIDLDGDGQSSVLIGSVNGYGYGYVVDATGFLELDDEAGRYADVSWSGVAGSGSLGGIGKGLADNTGDGTPDLVVQGNDQYNADRGNRALVVFDGTALGLELTPSNAVLTMSAGTQYNGGVVSDTDIDGDGIAEIAAGVYSTFDDRFRRSRGTVFLHSVAGESGDQSLVDDADAILVGQNDYDYLGRMPVGADLDGDGYGDLIVGASRESSGANAGGMVYIVAGGRELPDGPVDATARARIQGEAAGGYLGYGARPLVADVDGDDIDDLVISSVYEDTVYVFSDASSVEGELDARDADIILDGSSGPDFYGFGLAAGDFDGDSDPELAVGAPDTYAYRAGGIADRGEISIYDLTGATPRRVARIHAEGRQDTFGQTLYAADLDGDGRDELMADAPGYEGGGRVYFLAWGSEGL